MRTSLAGVVVLLHLSFWFPFSARLMGASDALSVSTRCPALWTDLGREQHLPKHPPATASKWGTAPVLFIFGLLSSKTLKSH